MDFLGDVIEPTAANLSISGRTSESGSADGVGGLAQDDVQTCSGWTFAVCVANDGYDDLEVSSAIACVDLLVHRKALIGSPAVVSSKIRVNSARSWSILFLHSPASGSYLPNPALRRQH